MVKISERPLMPNTYPSQATNAPVSVENLTLYEVQRPFVEPLLRWCRLWNTAFDTLFYDVGLLTEALWKKGWLVETEASAKSNMPRQPLTILDLSAQSNPSGSIIVVDANLAPYVGKPFLDMNEFFQFANGEQGEEIHTLTVSGVGSSAFGSVAFAWDASEALAEPVAAIVPGYGLADVVPQALGGWFGFEMYDAIQSATQELLANFAPTLAMMGKDLARSTPGRETAPTGAPVFRHGSAASDDVHAILRNVSGITRVIGHSKGALAIENALRSLTPNRTTEITVHTFGCVISEETSCKRYSQYLGLIDALGMLNSGDNLPEHRPFADHSTNSLIPLSLQVTDSLGYPVSH
jgi:hypothetical protein